MEAQAKYINDAQQRILSALCLLAGNEMQGLSPSDLAREMKVGASTITRDLANLKEAGFAEQIPETGRWRLGPRPVQIAIKFQSALGRAVSRVDELKNRYTRAL